MRYLVVFSQRLEEAHVHHADPARCHADSLCLRVHAMEPTMPIAPKLADGIVNPCIETKDGGLHNPVHP